MKKSDLFRKAELLKERLQSELFGEESAIEEVVSALLHLEFSPVQERYKGLFTFLGPHNSGKTHLARLLAKYCDEFESFALFDMAEYADPADWKRLIGSEGALTAFIRENPASIVLFKDIEKADNSVQLAILNYIRSPDTDSGADFSRTLVIFSSTLGSSTIKKKEFWDFYRREKIKAEAKIIETIAKEKKVLYDLVEDAIDPGLLSVMVQNYLVLFRPLSFDAIYRIAEKSLKEAIEIFRARSGIALEFRKRKSFLKLLVLSFSPYINARRIRRKLPDLFLDLVTRSLAEAKDLPSRIRFDVGREAQSFLKHQRIDETYIRELAKRNESIEPDFEVRFGKGELRILLKNAVRKKLPHYTTPYEKPSIYYSELSFADIAGQKSVKKNLREILDVLKHPELTQKFAIEIPKGMLLYGPKGVGKTLLAKAFAKEADLPYLYLSGSDLFDENIIRAAYENARELAPAIVFLDGVDTKGLIEGVYTTMPVETAVAEIDALTQKAEEFIFTVATATEREEVNKILIAPGRIDIFIEVPELDMEARKFFIRKILEKPNDGKIDIEKVARFMSGMSGYEMQRVGKEAALYVIRKGLDRLSEAIIIEQINNIKYGYKVEKRRIRNIEEDLHRTAYHEAGHSVLSYVLLPDIRIEQVTITPRAEALGFVSYTGEEMITNLSRRELFNEICVALAGRIAKRKKFPEEGVDTGAFQDLEQATMEAYNAIASFGMDEELGNVQITVLNQNVSESLYREKIEERVQKWIDEATAKTELLVDRYWEKIERVAAQLIEKEIVDGAELKRIMEGA